MRKGKKEKDWNAGSWKSVPHLERGESKKNQMMRRYKNKKSEKILYSAKHKTMITLSGYYNYLFNICRGHMAIPNEALL